MGVIGRLEDVFAGFLFELFFDLTALPMITSAPFMSSREIQDLAGTVVDSLKFAAEGGNLSGKLALSSLPRLSDVLTTREGWLECHLSGSRSMGNGGQARSVLSLKVSGRLGLRCQRCLAVVWFDCIIDNRLLLIPEGADWPEDELESEEYDALPASREQSVRELVEEEVLLALPIVPRHADCLPPVALGEGEEANGSSPNGSSPFAALAGLKKH
ncbi:MAG: YceD family protein [Pseudomonadota bacterium]